MTDCFIMIHVIIFFVGVTNMLSGTVPCGLAGGSTGAAGVGIQRSALFRGENLCSEGVCRVCWACVYRITVYKFPLALGGILLSVWSGAAPEARLSQTLLQKLSQL